MRKFAIAYALVAGIAFVPVVFGSAEAQRLAYHVCAPLALAGIVTGLRLYRPVHRLPWLFMAGTMVSFTASSVLLEARVRGWTTFTGSVTPLDLTTLAGYVFMVLAFTSFARRRSLTKDLGAVLDIALLVVGGSVVAYQLVLQPVFEVSRALLPATRALVLAFPLIDYLLLVVLVRILVSPGRRPAALGVLVAAMATAAGTDMVIAALRAGHPLGDYSWGYIGSYAAIVLLGAAALFPSMAAVGTGTHDASPRLGWVRLAAIGTALALPAVTAIAGADGAIDWAMLLVPSVVMIVLVMTRVRLLFGSLSRSSREIERRQEYFKSLVDNITDIVLVTGRDGCIRDRTESAAVVFAPGGGSPIDRADPEDVGDLVALLKEAAASPGRALHGDVRLLDAEGAPRHFEVVVRDLTRVEAVGGVVWVLHDVSAQKRFEEKLRHQALHDALTGLPNRVLFGERLAWARARRDVDEVAVLFVDLDDFKGVNDSLGHDAGDQLLRGVADRLVSAVRAEDTVARLGGDEFAVIVQSDGIDAVAERVVEALRSPFDLAGRRMVVTASIGAAVVGRDDDTDVLGLADIAMYRAKTEGKDSWVLFRDGMETAPMSNVGMDADLLRAVDGDELRVVYQPVVTLDRRRVVGVEALVRWEHPSQGLLAPAAFLPTAERNGLVVAVDRFVLREACRQAVAWSEAYGVPLTMAVNVSTRQLDGGEGLVDAVRAALDETGLAPERLVLEFDESVLADDDERSAAALQALKAVGVRIAVDDFGGRSSLSRLGRGRLPIDILKIDRGLVAAATGDEDAGAFVRALAEFGAGLGLETMVEGIEEEAQADALDGSSCELGQGFLFAEPQPADAAEELLAAAFALQAAS